MDGEIFIEIDLKGKLDLYIKFRYENVLYDRRFTDEEKLKGFINELLNNVKEDLNNGYNGDFEIIEIVNNLDN